MDHLQRIRLDRRDVERRNQRVEARAQHVVRDRPFPHEESNENFSATISSQHAPSSGRTAFRQLQELPMRARFFATLAVLIALPAFASITGTVMTRDGQPLAGAKVSVYSFESADARRARLTRTNRPRP